METDQGNTRPNKGSSSTGDDDDSIVLQLMALHKAWCASSSSDLYEGKENNKGKRNNNADEIGDSSSNNNESSTINEIKNNNEDDNDKSTLNMAVDLIATLRETLSDSNNNELSKVVAFLIDILYGTMSDTTTTTSVTDDKINDETNEQQEQQQQKQTDAASRLKQIEWHIVLLLELWTHLKGRFVDVCSQILLQVQKEKKKKQKKKKQHKHKEKRKKVGPRERILNHIVDLLTQTPFWLPINISLGDFMTNHCLSRKRQWTKLPDIFMHLFGTFEIPNPYLKTDNDTTSSSNNLLLNDVNAPLSQDSFTDTFTASNPKKRPQEEKKDDLKNSNKKKQLHQQHKHKQKKQRVLTTLKKNRFQITSSSVRSSHFHNNNIQNISKVWDTDTNSTTTGTSQKRKRDTDQRHPSTIITPHPTSNKKNGQKYTNKAKKDSLVSSLEIKSSSGTITNNKNDKEVILTPPTGTSKHVVFQPTNLDNDTIFATPQPLQLPDKSTATATTAHYTSIDMKVVEETPSFPRIRTTKVQETPTEESTKHVGLYRSNNLHNMKKADDSIVSKVSNNKSVKPTVVQPVKLFGTIKPVIKKDTNTNDKKIPSSRSKTIALETPTKTRRRKTKSYVDVARALLRRKSI